MQSSLLLALECACCLVLRIKGNPSKGARTPGSCGSSQKEFSFECGFRVDPSPSVNIVQHIAPLYTTFTSNVVVVYIKECYMVFLECIAVYHVIL